MMTESWLQPDWPSLPGVNVRVTTRFLPGGSAAPFDAGNLGDRCGDDPASVHANRAALIDRLELPSEPFWLHQVHGTHVHRVDSMRSDAAVPQADASVTQLDSQVLVVLTADCLPVLFAADDGSEVGVAHAGWRGLAAGVLEATVQTMRTRPERILAWLGPGIGAASYEVGADVRQTFLDTDAGSAAAFHETRAGHWTCDLYSLARRRLSAAGIAHIGGGDFDTFRDRRFYSYRREAPCGRFASLIWRG